MSIFNDKSLKGVADVVSQIIQQEATHPKTDKEKDLAALAEPKDKITHKDVLVGRGVLKKEEKHEGASKEKETKFHTKLDKLVHKTFGHSPAEKKDKMKKEETEQLQEYESKSGVYTHKGSYGKAKGTEYGSTDWDKEEKESKSMTAKKEPVKRGARQNYVRSKRVSGKAYESFSDMLAMYNEMGLKSINEMFFKEEPDNEQFTREVEAAKKRANEKKSPEDEARVAKASVQAVKVEEDVEQIDELSVQTMRSAEQKLKHKADDERMDDNKAGMRHYLGRAVKVGAKASAKERAERNAMKNEEIDNKKHPFVAVHAKKGTHETHGSTSYEAAQNAAKHWKMKSTAGISVHRADVKHIATESLEEGAMKEIHMDIHDHLGKHVSNYKKMGGADHLGNKSTETAKKISKMHNIPQHHAQKLVNDYVDNALKEDVEQIDERTLSEPETQEKERIVKGMKKKLSSFKDRYGDRAKSVMYATATKLAKED